MGAIHYSAAELAAVVHQPQTGRRLRDHLDDCEQCRYLFTLVRRSRGEPSDEDAEVTLDSLKRWLEH